jgi:hypothetical protein
MNDKEALRELMDSIDHDGYQCHEDTYKAAANALYEKVRFNERKMTEGPLTTKEFSELMNIREGLPYKVDLTKADMVSRLDNACGRLLRYSLKDPLIKEAMLMIVDVSIALGGCKSSSELYDEEKETR